MPSVYSPCISTYSSSFSRTMGTEFLSLVRELTHTPKWRGSASCSFWNWNKSSTLNTCSQATKFHCYMLQLAYASRKRSQVFYSSLLQALDHKVDFWSCSNKETLWHTGEDFFNSLSNTAHVLLRRSSQISLSFTFHNNFLILQLQGLAPTIRRQRSKLKLPSYFYSVHCLFAKKKKAAFSTRLISQHCTPDLQFSPFFRKTYSCSVSWTCTSCDKSTCKLEREAIVTNVPNHTKMPSITYCITRMYAC